MCFHLFLCKLLYFLGSLLSSDMLYTFEDKATVPDQIWPYSTDIASPLIIDNGWCAVSVD